MSEDTKGSSLYDRTPWRGAVDAADANAELMSSTEGLVARTAVKSVIEPSGIGTLKEVPSSFPFMDWRTSPVARAAPVEVGIMFTADARALRKSLWGPSTRDWSPV